MDWLPWARRAPGPPDHVGYRFLNILPRVEKKYGKVIHSSGGRFQPGNMPVDIMAAPPLNSWWLSIFRDGVVEQHYPMRTVCWHAGGPMQNLLLEGIEMDGRHHEPWTEVQTASLKRVLKETWDYGEPKWGSELLEFDQELVHIRVLEHGQNLWNHCWLSPTDCPGSRNDAHRQEIIDWLEEGDMATEAQWMTWKEEARRNFERVMLHWPLSDREKAIAGRDEAEQDAWREFYDAEIERRLGWIGRG